MIYLTVKMGKRINILVVPSDTFGVGLYRSLSPHHYLQTDYESLFNVQLNYAPVWENLEYFKDFDIIHIHKGIYPNMEAFWKFLDWCKENKITTIMDIDDNWDVGPQHPMYSSVKLNKIPEKIIENLRRFDYVTTTTEIFADKIRKYNKNVFVYPNAINPDEDQYKPIKNPTKRIRFGFVMGSAHEKDMEQFKGVVNALPKDILDKIQIVLCGYDIRGTISTVDEHGNVVGQRQIKPEESVWKRYEEIVTDNYNICSPMYKEFLQKYICNAQWPLVENEPYRREWTKDVKEFATHYRNIDVLFAPLAENNFNLVKSELKFIEGGFTRTAVIATKFGPYTIGSKSLFKYGGEIDPEGNCILIDPEKKHKAWGQAIKKIVQHPEYIGIMTENMYNTVKDKYNIHNVTAIRAEWYKSIVKK